MNNRMSDDFTIVDIPSQENIQPTLDA